MCALPTLSNVPPQNKPTGAEINTCRDAYLIPEIKRMTHLRAILALGRIAHQALIKTMAKDRLIMRLAMGQNIS